MSEHFDPEGRMGEHLDPEGNVLPEEAFAADPKGKPTQTANASNGPDGPEGTVEEIP